MADMTFQPSRILVVDDEESLRLTFKRFLSDAGHTVELASTLAEGLERVRTGPVDLVLADIHLGDGTGIDILREIRNEHPGCPVVLITGNPSAETAAEALRLGAFDYIPKPVRQDLLLRITRHALEQKRIEEERTRYRLNLEAIFRSVQDGIVTVDRSMNIIAVNQAAETLCGLAPGPAETVDGRCRERCLKLIEQTLATRQGMTVDNLECRRSDDHLQTVSVTTQPLLDANGQETGVVAVLRDRTRYVQMERDLGTWRAFHNIIGQSEKMHDVFEMIRELANVPTTVLITGESGTGKELVASALHFGGNRKGKPFIKVDCMSLPEELLESELFGHVKGAFTGAISDRQGRFERADGGTIFLDEIGDITPRLQLRLLRVLQEREFERVGGSKPIKVDVRVITATNQDLREKVRQGRFREDLYYRLNVVELSIPPLRQRRDDIPLLIPVFIKKFSLSMNKDIEGVSSDVENLLMAHDWPGNVRELENVIEHACVRCKGTILTADTLPKYLYTIQPRPAENSTIDRERVLEALRRAGQNKAKAARLLGMSRQHLYRKMKEFQIDAE